MDARDLYAYVVTLRWRLLEALRSTPAELLHRDMHTNHGSIIQTLLHVMALEQSWIADDIQGELRGATVLTWPEIRNTYLEGQQRGEESLDTVIAGWQRVTAETLDCLRSEPDLRRQVMLEPPPADRAATVEQIIFHIATEELIHMGEVLAMTRQLGIDLPSYFLMDIMSLHDRPWEQWSGARNQ